MKHPHYTSDNMLDAAFKFRQTNLWEIIDARDVFAVQLPSGKIGYCIVMGTGGTYFGLGMYRGSTGFSTYLRMINPPKDHIAYFYDVLTYDAIICNFSQAGKMNFGLKEPVREFSKRYGCPIPKKNGWPEFLCYTPFRRVAPVNDEEDGNDIATALLAAVWLSEQFNTKTHEDLGMDYNPVFPSREGGKAVPLIVPDGEEGFHMEMTALPAFEDFEYPAPELTDKETIEKIKSLPKGDSLEAGTLSVPIKVKINPDNAAVVMVPIMYKGSGMMFGLASESAYDKHPEQLLMQFVTHIVETSSAPSGIICTDGLTAALLRDFCIKTKTPQFTTKRSAEFDGALRFLSRTLIGSPQQ